MKKDDENEGDDRVSFLDEVGEGGGGGIDGSLYFSFSFPILVFFVCRRLRLRLRRRLAGDRNLV